MSRGSSFSRKETDATPRRVFGLPPSFQLHSSFIPSAEDEVSIKHAIEKILTTVDSVDEDIFRLESTLADLQGYRADLLTKVQKYCVVLSPMRRLPAEILGEIFLFAAAGHPVKWPFPSEGRYSMPWVLGQVCSYWRTVAISLPRLWSEIYLDLSSVDTDFDDEQVTPITNDYRVKKGKLVAAMFETCLERSRKEPLTFAFKSLSESQRPCIKPIIGSLVEHAERWVNVDISWEALTTYREDLKPVKNRLPNLTKLDIGIASDLWLFNSDLQIDIFEQAPKLRELRLAAIPEPLRYLVFPWSQITTLVTSSCHFQEGEFTQIMRNAINLESFTTKYERILEVASSSPVYLPRLQDLNIVTKGSYIPKIFQFLTMPNLKKLSIRALTPFLADLTLPMLTRSQCNPTHLTFFSSLDPNGTWEENISVVKLLSALPSVTDLHLTVLKSEEQIMPRLEYHRRQGTPSVLPNLRRIEVDDRLCSSANKVVDALSSRLEGHDHERWGSWPEGQPGLQSIVLSLWRPLASQYPELNILRSAANNLGVNLQVSTY